MAFGKVTLSGAVDNIKEGWTKFNSLIDDLLSVANGKGASQIGIEDSAGNMAATDVEAALAEIYSDHSSTRTLAEIFDENTVTTTGLTWGYNGGNIRVDNVVTTVTASTILLTNNATNYVEIQQDGTVAKNTTGFTSGRIPIRTIVTASGEQTTSTDSRAWFAQVAASSVSTSIINADLVAGVFTFNHGLNISDPLAVVVWNNNNKEIEPDEITFSDANNVLIDLSSYGTITGTWKTTAIK